MSAGSGELGDDGDHDRRGERLVKGFLALAMSSREGYSDRGKLSANLFEGRPWLSPGSTVFLFASDSLQLFADLRRDIEPRILLYDEMADYIVYLGATPHIAAEMWNFPDLRKWRYVDNATGKVTKYCVSDPELTAQIDAEFAETYGSSTN